MTAGVWTSILLGTISILQALLLLSFKSGGWVRDRELSAKELNDKLQDGAEHFKQIDLRLNAIEDLALVYRMKAIEKTLDQAGEEMSKLATKVQGMEERFRNEFITRNECDIRERRINGGKLP